MDYPLYDILAEISVEDIDPIAFCSAVNSISRKGKNYQEHYAEIYALILHYHMKNNVGTQVNPFGSKIMTGGKGITFDFAKLPLPLQKILWAYLIYYSD